MDNQITPPQPPTPDPQQVMCECGHRVGDHYLQYFHPELCKGSLDCKCKLNQNEVTLESELNTTKIKLDIAINAGERAELLCAHQLQEKIELQSELTRLKSACAKEHESVQKIDEENQRLRVQLVNLSNAASIFSGHMEVVLVSLRTELSKSQEALNQTTESAK